uniref:Intron-binding protein aquarius n=3 Tax=Plectus sambesii TaxID=2011161 RepID=A0A914V800_9BILA
MVKRKTRKSDSGGKKSLKGVPTVEAIQKTEINEMAVKYWAPYVKKHLPFDAKIVQHLYTNELLGSLFSHNKVVLLEFSQYLEAFLWPNYNPKTSPNEHLLSIIAMVNEKYRERVPAWGCFVRDPEKFNGFFRKVLEAALDEKEELAKIEQSLVLTFLVHCFDSVEVDVVRAAVQRLASLPCWINLLPTQREDQFAQNTKLKKFWQVIQKHDAKLDKDQLQVAEFERRFLWRLLHKFFDVLDDIPLEGEIDMLTVHYCERALELMIDLEALLPTRRFFNALLDASHAITRCTLSALIRREEGALFCELLQMLRFYAKFEIDDVTGQQLTEGQMTDRHYAHVTSLQKAAFKHFKDSMREFFLLNVGSVDTRKALVKLFTGMGKEDLYKFAEYMHMVPPLTESTDDFEEMSHEFLTEMLVSRCERRPNQLQQLNEMPLYPTEAIIWDENMVPYEHYNGEGVLALNKLNLQFLTLHDYLLRNFTLFQMESTYEIRKDLEDSILRMKPWLHENGRDVVWGGWARMSQPIINFTIVEVSKPNIGEKCPSSVRADITIHLGKRADIRHEWEGLRKHDVCFLVTCRPTKAVGTKYDVRLPFKEQFEVAYVRGCEVEGMLDGQGRIIEEFGTEPRPMVPGDARSFRVWLDTNQYRLDMEKHVATQNEDLYETFNLLVRRDAKSNNFKAVLDTMRQLLNTECVVPDWLHDLILGYGEPDAAQYAKMPNTVASMDFNDTFVDYQNLLSAFPDHKVVPTVNDPELLVPPFRLTFKELEPQHGVDPEKRDKSIVVEPHVIPSRGPYPYSEPKKNTIRFTPAQVEAIKSGMEPGLTMVVGPPGTGKTDVAVQIISNIYHNWPEQRTLIVTHSNQALNQLFEKIMHLDIDERHLLRLGHGEEALETTKDFSRYGRVNYVLAQRLELLNEVERLQQSLGVVGDVAYTCETAQHFFLYQVYARWEEFEQATKKKQNTPTPSVESVAINFPFAGYFDNAPQPLFK